jgi:hypothetical protein
MVRAKLLLEEFGRTAAVIADGVQLSSEVPE